MTVEMHPYTYETNNRSKPHWYENQDHQHNQDTADTWTLHLCVPNDPAERDEILDVLSTKTEAEVEGLTGEYAWGDSFEEWQEAASPDDEEVHMTVYFQAPNKGQAVEVGRSLVHLLRDKVDTIRWDVSTAADHAEIVRR